jgi:very-short-patch-repair endonuclease
LRSTPNAAEQVLWSALKARQLAGFKFTRQFPIGPYVADFVCREVFLVIELDGSQHQDNAEYDQRRDAFMLRCGYSVLRVPSTSALNNLSGLCETILAVLDRRIVEDVVAPDLVFRRSGEVRSPRGRG